MLGQLELPSSAKRELLQNYVVNINFPPGSLSDVKGYLIARQGGECSIVIALVGEPEGAPALVSHSLVNPSADRSLRDAQIPAHPGGRVPQNEGA
jgi:broad specificity polyphosphatase/5'/3'-nucleotidase SurE